MYNIGKLFNMLDTITKKHSIHVANLVKEFTKELNMYSLDLYIGALLHDIGKLYVPKSILLKKEKLTKEEMDTIKLHPEYGEEIIKNSIYKDNEVILNMIKYHHLKYNGEGSYPKSYLEYDFIPLEARILSICDSYDAMTQNRGYNKVISKEEAIKRLLKDKGIKFDPSLVDKFIVFLNKKKAS